MKNAVVAGVSIAVALVLTVVLMFTVLKGENSDTPPEKTYETTSAEKQTEPYESEDDKSTALQTEPAVLQTSAEKTEAKKTGEKKESKSGSAVQPLGKFLLAQNLIEEDQPTPSLPVSRVSFVACGDNLIHSSVYADARTLAAGTGKEYNFIPMYDNIVDIIKEADLAFINQESPFGGSDRPVSGYPLFNTPDQMGYDLMELGYDVIGLANNHMLDSTSSGYKHTIEFWEAQKDKGIVAIGGYRNREDYDNIRVIEKNGIKIALLSYTYGTNGLSLPSGSELVIPLASDAEIDRQTKKAKEIADCVIVSVHWGIEDVFNPTDEQRRQAQIMVDNGVDVIIGHHPHVLQPMKWADRPDGGRTLIMYSLGNFLSGMQFGRNMVGGIMGFDVVKTPSGVAVTNASFIPTMCQYNNSVRGFKIYKFSEYTEDLERVHGAHRFDSSMSMSSLRRIIDNAIPQEFLIEDFYKD